ncbi:MAG: hypothetical protein P8L79_02505 [Rhodospirillaceae bacterium]|nr:hypothetical protein [Rhodospirillaceae bacterium]
MRIARCPLIGIGAFVMLLVANIKIGSGLDVASYVLGAGALWYVFELVIMTPFKKKPPPEVVEQYQAQKEVEHNTRFEEEIRGWRAGKKPNKGALGKDHF